MVTLQLCQVEARHGRRVIHAGASTPEIAGQRAGAGEVRITGASRADLRFMPQDTEMTAALTVCESCILALKQGSAGWRLGPGDLAAVDRVLGARKIGALAHLPLALHDLNQVMRACAMTLALAEGRVVAAGPTRETLSPALIRRLYSVEARVETCSRGGAVVIVDGAAAGGE